MDSGLDLRSIEDDSSADPSREGSSEELHSEGFSVFELRHAVSSSSYTEESKECSPVEEISSKREPALDLEPERDERLCVDADAVVLTLIRLADFERGVSDEGLDLIDTGVEKGVEAGWDEAVTAPGSKTANTFSKPLCTPPRMPSKTSVAVVASERADCGTPLLTILSHFRLS